ncbi:MAG: recombinase family protein [Lachnospiraceae bacterium]|nr:recombinase family protein [Lachnospiraceae bacterium]
MNVVAYCRVSTDKSDQLNSLETQKKFFQEYCEKYNLNLVHTYADEGISGTKIRNRKEFLRMMKDSEKGNFQQVLVKDVSRLARNTVDLLQSVRSLRALNIDTTFITANMQTMGNSEFVLTLLGAVAQEESSNTSKRIKFGKKENASRGKVPNLVYGYDKTNGDFFNLEMNPEETRIVKQIFDWYTEGGYGAAQIANMLNDKGMKTKRNCQWSQNAIARILKNEIYAGRIVNGKEEIADFLTGNRKEKEESEWMVTERPDLSIISQEQYRQAQNILQGRHTAFHLRKERQSNKYPFSTLIKCSDCGFSFRRVERKYKNIYISWVCSGRNANGTSSCENKTKVPEEELMEEIKLYLTNINLQKDKIIANIVKEFHRVYKAKDDNTAYEKELTATQNKLRKTKDKLTQMFIDDLISRAELNEKISKLNEQIEKTENELKIVEYNISKGDQLVSLVNQTFQDMEELLSMGEITNAQLKKVIKQIRVKKDGTIDIYLRLLNDIGLDEEVILAV